MEHELNWGLPVALDLFLAAMGAGAFLLAVATDFAGSRKYRTVSTTAAFIAPWPAIVGVLLLVVDLGKPLRFWGMMMSRSGDGYLGVKAPYVGFNPASTMSWGTWVLSLFVILSLCYIGASLIAYPFPWGATVKKLVGLAGVPFALMVMVYTGVLLSASSNSVWNTYMLPVAFVASAMVTGVASVILVLAVLRFLGVIEEESSYIPQLEKLNSRLIVFQLVAVVLFMVALLVAKAPLGAVVGGLFAPVWWVAVIGLGLIVPLLYGFKGKLRKPQSSVVVAALVLFGGFCLRYVILVAGQLPA